MTHAWTTLMAVFFTSMMNISAQSDRDVTENVLNQADYMAVDQIADSSCIVEKGGALHIIHSVMPRGQIREGDIVEWRLDSESVETRLASAHARLDRMQTACTVELEL